MSPVRNVVDKFIFFYAAIILLWFVSLFFSSSLRYYFWIVAVVLDITMPFWIKKSLVKQQARLSTSHLPERFGLFTLIVIGETIVDLVGGMAKNAFSLHAMVIAILGLIIIFTIWWLYYDNKNIMPTYKTFSLAFLWEYSHLLLMLGISVLGVCIHHIFSAYQQPSSFGLYLLFISFAVVMLSLLFLNISCYFCKKVHRKFYLRMMIFRFIIVFIVLLLSTSPK